MKGIADILPWKGCNTLMAKTANKLADAAKAMAGFMDARKAAACFVVATAAVGLLPVTAWAGTYKSSYLYITATSEGTKVSTSSSSVGTLDTDEIIITGTHTSGEIVISAEADCTAKVTFKNLSITRSSSSYAPVSIRGEGNVEIELDGTNTLTAGSGHAGLEKNDDKSSGTLTICDDNGTAGTLNATGGYEGAGIGGADFKASSNITITGGTITAQTTTNSNGSSAAGIGGGWHGDGYNINISGGTVKAYAGYYAAGIGGGAYASGHDIIISGGDVTAWGTTTKTGSGAGIGGGDDGDGYNIYIIGGTVDAKGSYYGGAGIGSGDSGRAYDIYISGGTVTARTGHSCAVAIGSDNESYDKKRGWGKIVISGGNVTTVSEYYGDNAIIGGYSYYALSEYVEIKNDAKVTLECRDYLAEQATWITTCELLEGGKVEWKRPNGDKAIYKTIEGKAGNEHTWGDQVDEKYILSDAVCNQPSYYYKSCTKCGMKSSTSETFLSEEAPGHLYKSITSTTQSWKYDDKTHYYECIRTNCNDRTGSHREEAEHTIEEWDEGGGWYYASCTVCGYSVDNYNYHEHTLDTMVKVEATDSNCAREGNIEYYQCPVTKKPYKYDSDNATFVAVEMKDVTIPKTAHKLVSDTYEHDSTNHWYVCSVCNQKFDIEVHTPSNWVPTEDNSKHTRECTVCHGTESVETEDHTYDTWGCDSDGIYHWKVCSKCNYADESNKTKHEFGEDKICIDCGYNMITGHALQFKEGKAATCTEDGYEAYYMCGTKGHESEIFVKLAAEGTGIYVFAEKPTAIPALGHKGGDDYKEIDSTYCAPVCVRDGCGVTITDKKDKHDFNADGICTKCGYSKTSGEHTHTYNDEAWTYNTTKHWHQCTDASCPNTKGSIIDEATHTFSGRQCIVCGYTKSSSSGSSNTNTGWIKDSKGWRFAGSDGIYVKGSTVTDASGNKIEKALWQRADSGYFAFGSDSYLVTGWLNDAESGKWYYCDENTGRQIGWFYSTADNHWYYLDPSTGAMLTGWQNINGKYYYLAGEPSAPTYSYDSAANKWIYNNLLGYYPYGAMYANAVTPDNYAVDASGAWVKQLGYTTVYKICYEAKN